MLRRLLLLHHIKGMSLRAWPRRGGVLGRAREGRIRRMRALLGAQEEGVGSAVTWDVIQDDARGHGEVLLLLLMRARVRAFVVASAIVRGTSVALLGGC